jgi:hypothetical protein
MAQCTGAADSEGGFAAEGDGVYQNTLSTGTKIGRGERMFRLIFPDTNKASAIT